MVQLHNFLTFVTRFYWKILYFLFKTSDIGTGNVCSVHKLRQRLRGTRFGAAPDSVVLLPHRQRLRLSLRVKPGPGPQCGSAELQCGVSTSQQPACHVYPGRVTFLSQLHFRVTAATRGATSKTNRGELTCHSLTTLISLAAILFCLLYLNKNYILPSKIFFSKEIQNN